MASEIRQSTTAVDCVLPLNGNLYSFFQAIRLINKIDSCPGEIVDNFRIRPHLGLGFPGNDINCITKNNDGKYFLEANFFGLYGVDSPLPVFYTEDLLEEKRQGGTAGRDFLDIFHASLYALFFRAWERNKLWLSTNERNDSRHLVLLESLLGVTDARGKHRALARKLFRFAGIFNQFPRNVMGLETLLKVSLDNENINVVSCVETLIAIEESSRFCLGVKQTTLGDDTILGQRVLDRSLTFDIYVSSLNENDFISLLPGGTSFNFLKEIISLYLNNVLTCRLVLKLSNDVRLINSLGNNWNQLGLNTWIGEESNQDAVTFVLSK
ncbi:type VI secretion system baseplate subunit TssG [Citrobacter sp. RHBSTW-00671]|uniref:type VI secretion system baseplate subunit TssG n=1 Tax=Citrobacter sp. RHBSTW-00671 TaxID=2742660 RepID=UPI00181764DA|nr:type VI secretion system baseplate subunit TssG [Citrobacter sp. RHBSTW-00671]MBA7966554.1 type VI secretion system baseplate subunit TssG [Citrobacter sp. RHBSTW-00671]HCJ6373900.1 type VI secretion system baseplate subunit TssG [Citrobacter freundii]